jgi:N-acyl-D-amino-acid deacylase
VTSPEGALLGRYAPDTSYVGKTIAAIAKSRRTDPASTLMWLIDQAQAYQAKHPDVEDVESVIGTSMDEHDVEQLIAWPWANICSDGELAGRHPRGYGAFPRVLGVYTRQRQVISFAEAVRKMTSLAARNVGIRDRGVIRPGAFADLVLFDTLAVLDQATTAEPQLVSSGIRAVWVNGEMVYDQGKPTGKHPGRALRRRGPAAGRK